MYFSKFPLVQYDSQDSGDVVAATNITVSFRLSELIRSNADMFFEYIVKDTDRPDIIAHKLYGRSDLHWLVFLMNDIENVYTQWPLPRSQLESYISGIYGAYQSFYVDVGNIPDIHANNFVVGATISQSTSTATIVSWNTAYQSLGVTGISGSFSTGTTTYTQNSDGNTYGFNITRIIQDSSEAIHHFANTTGDWLDPNAYYIDNEQSRVIGVPLSGTSLIENYIFSGVPTTEIITNREYEEAENESKRTIKLLRPEYVDPILQQYEIFQKQTYSVVTTIQ